MKSRFLFSLPHARLQKSREIDVLVSDFEFASDFFPLAVYGGSDIRRVSAISLVRIPFRIILQMEISVGVNEW